MEWNGFFVQGGRKYGMEIGRLSLVEVGRGNEKTSRVYFTWDGLRERESP